MRALLLVLLFGLAGAAVAADPSPFADVSPNCFPAEDPLTKDKPRTLSMDVRRRMQAANLRESEAFAAITTREQWEKHRDARLAALRGSLGTFPDPPKDVAIRVTGKIAGDGFVVHNLVYESRPGVWVTANLYLPSKTPDKMPGLVIAHSHHSPATQGELQDMGMTWARAGSAVIVPEILGHGERRQHTFNVEKDYPKPFRTGRQDYYFRFNTATQLHLIGDSFMGWMAWDFMRGIDVLMKQPNIDKDRIIMLGAVAGGGDPAGVTAALDSRIAAVVPFNFSGWQPESSSPPMPDRDFAWFGDGYWETSRGLKGGAAGGFAHYIITGSIAPRRLVYAHEFKWDPKIDPAWPRLEKIYGFYDAKDRLAFAHGSGTLQGKPPESSHCNNIGAVHRKMIYPAFQKWFGMPIPEEFSQRRTAAELMCWTDEARKELKPRMLHEAAGALADERIAAARKRLDALPPNERREQLRKDWEKLLGDVTPGKTGTSDIPGQDVPGGHIRRTTLHMEPGVQVPFMLITPNPPPGTPAKGPNRYRPPVVVMVAQAGKGAFLKDRGDVIAAFLKAHVAVCLVDVRGTGETRPGDGSPNRTATRTSIAQTELILGQTLLGSQLRDVRGVIHRLQDHVSVDGKRIAIWGDSFATTNSPDRQFAAPLDAPDLPTHAEPLGGLLALLVGLFEDGVSVVYARGGLSTYRSMLDSPYFYVPYDATVPGAVAVGDLPSLASALAPRPLRLELMVDGRNVVEPAEALRAKYAVTAAAYPKAAADRLVMSQTVDPAGSVAWVVEQLKK